jgi:hypothetical protein
MAPVQGWRVEGVIVGYAPDCRRCSTNWWRLPGYGFPYKIIIKSRRQIAAGRQIGEGRENHNRYGRVRAVHRLPGVVFIGCRQDCPTYGPDLS